MAITKDITRYVRDTYPITLRMLIENNPIDLTGKDVQLYYEELQLDGTTVKLVKIAGVIIDDVNASVVFYPKLVYTQDITDPANPIDYDPFTIPGVFKYSITVRNVAFDKYANGDYVYDPVLEDYIPYDPNDPNQDGLTRYLRYFNTTTIYVGKIEIIDRVGE